MQKFRINRNLPQHVMITNLIIYFSFILITIMISTTSQVTHDTTKEKQVGRYALILLFHANII